MKTLKKENGENYNLDEAIEFIKIKEILLIQVKNLYLN